MADEMQDQQLGMDRPIARRDFLNGVAIAIGSAAAQGFLPCLAWMAEGAEQSSQDQPGYYPPTLTGMRGSHAGSFEVAHSERDGNFWKHAGTAVETGETYDLVVVGGGMSGLAAAYFHRQQNPSSRVLILDNHDDFGGHAKRNEFHVNGHMLLANGGTVSIESPFPYSAEARGLIADLGIEPAKFEEKYDDSKVYKGLKSAYFFDQETFGTDRLVVGGPAPYGRQGGVSWPDFLAKTPLSEAVQKDIVRVQEAKVDYLPGLSSDEKKDKLSRISYKQEGRMGKNPTRKMTRRNFVGVAVGAAAAGVQVAVPASQISSAQAGASSTSPTAGVDQNPIRRRGTGLRALDAARAAAGLTLFSAMLAEGTGTVYLINLRGEVVHTWKMPYPPGLYGYLTDKGTLFYNGKIPNDTFLGKSPFKGGAVLEVDWNGKVLWEVRNPHHHHDGRLLKNGNVLLLCATELPDNVAKRVQGGRPGTEVDGKMWADYLVEITKDGRMVWEWRSWEHLDPAKDTITAIQENRREWTHGNAIVELPDGNLLVSFRNISTIIKIDRQTGDIMWKLAAPPLSAQHAPAPLPNGNILIFDNGPHRLDNGTTFSRVIEVNPATKEIVWKYQEQIPWNFYSFHISNAQRLPNGNTLINEGAFGRFFEVTSEGQVVWEYVNPYFGPESAGASAQSNSVFRAYRYTEDQIEKAQKS